MKLPNKELREFHFSKKEEVGKRREEWNGVCIFKKRKPLEYKDIECIIRFNFFAGEDEIRRILNIFADAVQEYENMIPKKERD